MRGPILAALLVATAAIAAAAPTPKEQLMTPPATARHYTISSTAGKHGDIWSWKQPDGKIAYRMSMSLRGWVTEDDELITLGADGRPTELAVRGYTDQGDATENFNVDSKGVAHWKTVIDNGSAPFAGKRYSSYGGPWLANDVDVDALVAAGDKGLDLLPSGHASISIGQPVQAESALFGFRVGGHRPGARDLAGELGMPSQEGKLAVTRRVADGLHHRIMQCGDRGKRTRRVSAFRDPRRVLENIADRHDKRGLVTVVQPIERDHGNSLASR